MIEIIIRTLLGLISLVVLSYFASYLWHKKNRVHKSYFYLTPSEKIVDTAKGGNQAPPVEIYLNFIKNADEQAFYSSKGDFNE